VILEQRPHPANSCITRGDEPGNAANSSGSLSASLLEEFNVARKLLNLTSDLSHRFLEMRHLTEKVLNP
jgi:hypothetical protein